MEGQNLQHLKYGTSGAQQLTASFWVKSSVAAVFGIYMYSGDGVRIIGSTYTINSANTWEYKTVTFVGDTGGTINNDNGDALYLGFVLAAGSGMRTTDNTSWGSYSSGKLAYGHTAAANAVMTTSGATWQLTGVQLEVGDTATPFEHRSFGDELARCQRYFQKEGYSDFSNTNASVCTGVGWSSGLVYCHYPYPAGSMRTKPTATLTGDFLVLEGGTSSDSTENTIQGTGINSAEIRFKNAIVALNSACWIRYKSGSSIQLDAEL